MRHFAYLAVLLISLGGLVVADLAGKRRLTRPSVRRAILATAGLLLAGDLVGIGLGIFYANPDYLCGWFLTPQLPVEEIFLLLLISYMAVVHTYRHA